MSQRPNIVLVMSDQQRMDTLSCYGNRFTETPETARMAAAGMCFDTALTPWPVCTPARATAWTGVYPSTHRLIDNLYGVDNAFATHSAVKRTLFDHLQDAGYRTAHFGKWHLGETQPPFFDHWEESFNSRRGHWIDGRLDGEYRPDRATDAATRWIGLQARAERPFAMLLSFYPPHDPYSAPERFYAPYRGRGVPFAGYYAAVSALDHDLGRVRSALAAAGLAENTVVLYFSDHGDTFWYRREGEHKFVCHDDAIRIPLLVEGPGIAPGSRSDLAVGLQDLAPTLLDIAGAGIPPAMQGRSLLPLLQGRRPEHWRDGFYVENITHVSAIHQRAWRTDAWKLIVSADGRHELYDLARRPRGRAGHLPDAAARRWLPAVRPLPRSGPGDRGSGRGDAGRGAADRRRRGAADDRRNARRTGAPAGGAGLSPGHVPEDEVSREIPAAASLPWRGKPAPTRCARQAGASSQLSLSCDRMLRGADRLGRLPPGAAGQRFSPARRSTSRRTASGFQPSSTRADSIRRRSAMVRVRAKVVGFPADRRPGRTASAPRLRHGRISSDRGAASAGRSTDRAGPGRGKVGDVFAEGLVDPRRLGSRATGRSERPCDRGNGVAPAAEIIVAPMSTRFATRPQRRPSGKWPGQDRINGTPALSSCIVFFHHNPRSPACSPWSDA